MKRLTLVLFVKRRNAPQVVEYMVQEVGNTTSFSPGDRIDTNSVTALCEDPDWDVTIVPAE